VLVTIQDKENYIRDKGEDRLKKFTILLLALSSQLYGSEKTLYEEVIYNKPDLGDATEVYLGDRMLSQQVGAWKECITPKNTFLKKSMGWVYTYKGGEPICKTKVKDKYYLPTYINAVGFDQDQLMSVRWKKKGNKSSLCGCNMGFCGGCAKKLSEDAVEEGETFVYRENSWQQTIEYAGRSGDILKFAYSEFSDGWARQAFTREFQVDLSEGNIAAYKGAIIEIAEATNVQIKYKVIRNFSSDQ
jgi:hypothetical protein